ncbi:pumilio homology domain family member 6, partial [Tremellales sp. Uapishka_1]
MSSRQQGTKRSFPSGGNANKSGGPKSKFAKTTSSSGPSKFSKPSNGKPAASKQKPRSNPKEDATQRRKKPVTQGGGEEDVDMSGEEEDYEEVPAEEDIEMEHKDENGGAEQEKKPRMSKAEKLALHAAQPHRTSLLASHPLLHDTLLPLWETARREDVTKEERVKIVGELYQAVKGRVGEVSRGHKGGRVLQTIIKYGGKEERLGVAMELQPQWRAMMESKYSKFLMSKLIRYLPQIRPLLIPHLTPHLLSLLSHTHALGPLSDFYDLYASSKERKLLVRGFYPREVVIFDGGKEGKDVKGLEGTLDDMGADGKGRERILEGIEKTVLQVFNATQKTALAQSIFHRLVLEYLTCIYKFLEPEAADKMMHELLTAALESLPEIVHTKDGSAVVRELIARGNAKDRKSILQHLRKHLDAMCRDGDAQMVLFTIFDCVDDTKLVGKAIVSDIVALSPSLVFDKLARRVLLYLIVPTATRHFIPSTLSSLAASAQIAREAGTSKKDTETRRKELLSYATEGLIKCVEEKGEEMVRDPGAGLVVQEIMVGLIGDKTKAIDTLLEPLRTPYPDQPVVEASPDNETAHPLDLSHAVRTYKTLLSGGHFNTKTSKLEIVDEALSAQFARAFWKAITSDESGGKGNARRIARGNAPFVVVELIGALKGTEEEKEVKDVFGGEAVRHEVEKSGRKGAGTLVEVLEKL